MATKKQILSRSRNWSKRRILGMIANCRNIALDPATRYRESQQINKIRTQLEAILKKWKPKPIYR